MKTGFKLDGLNIEVTNYCPLKCPQCYCYLEGGKNIPLNVIYNVLDEASKMGVSHVEFSGGETLCYPDIFEAIEIANKFGLSSGISISGWGFNKNVYSKLLDAGITSIHVSLNAPVADINKKTRDGYELSIAALELLKNMNFKQTTINWVMHRETVPLFEDMIKLAERYCVYSILIIDPKPNSKNELDSYPTKEQLLEVAKKIKKNSSSVKIEVHHCFSPLAALVGENKLWGNMNRGLYKGCTAGICSICVDVDGNYIPCRHLAIPEKRDSLEDYWNNSELINQLRDLDNDKRKPCKDCRYSDYCRHCLAINSKLHNDIYIGNEHCPIYEEK